MHCERNMQSKWVQACNQKPQIHHIVEVLSHHRDCGFASRSGIGMCDLVRCFTEFLGPARCTKSEGECLNYVDCMGEIPCQSEHWSYVVQGFKKWTLRQNHIPQAQITWIRPSGGPQPTIFISTSHWLLDHYSPYWSLDHYSLPTYLSICTQTVISKHFKVDRRGAHRTWQ